MEGRYVYTKTYCNYGKINLTINRLLKQKHIKPYKLSMLTGIRYDVLKKYVDGSLYRIDLDVIARICFSLKCDLDDILNYNYSKSNDIKEKVFKK